MKPGTVLGHEAVGEVTDIGHEVRAVRPGDQVIVSSVRRTDPPTGPVAHPAVQVGCPVVVRRAAAGEPVGLVRGETTSTTRPERSQPKRS